MSLTQLKEKAAQLPTSERKELIGFLLAQGRTERESAELRRDLASELDNKDPDYWVPLHEVRKDFEK